MARTGSLAIDGGDLKGNPTERILDLTSRLNDRLLRIKNTIDSNDGSAIHWTDASLPTASVEFAGRFLYHDLGQGATPDNLYVCLWDGAAWAWSLLA